jgi:hypothetical protein
MSAMAAGSVINHFCRSKYSWTIQTARDRDAGEDVSEIATRDLSASGQYSSL